MYVLVAATPNRRKRKGEGRALNPPLSILVLKIVSNKYFSLWGRVLFVRLKYPPQTSKYPSLKIVNILPWTQNAVKEDHIGSTVSLHHLKQKTDRHPITFI